VRNQGPEPRGHHPRLEVLGVLRGGGAPAPPRGPRTTDGVGAEAPRTPQHHHTTAWRA